MRLTIDNDCEGSEYIICQHAWIRAKGVDSIRSERLQACPLALHHVNHEYGAHTQLTNVDDSPPVDGKRAKQIIGVFLFYALAGKVSHIIRQNSTQRTLILSTANEYYVVLFPLSKS